MQAVAMPDWRVNLQQQHEGYMTPGEFVKNRERLQQSRTNGEETVWSGPAREGLALLQGLLLCGNCGHALTVRYRGNGGICPTYQCNLLRREGLATKSCMVFRCDLLDGVIAQEMLRHCSRPNWNLPWRICTSWNHEIRRSCANGGCGSSVLSMKSRWPSGATRRSIPPIVWWQAHWSGAGTMRCFTWMASKKKLRNFSVRKPTSPRLSRR